MWLLHPYNILQVPIIAPVRQKQIEVEERKRPQTTYSTEFLTGLMANPELIRNVVIAGHLHHGKTLVQLIEMIITFLCRTTLIKLEKTRFR